MATVFKNAQLAAVGTTPTTLYTGNTGTQNLVFSARLTNLLSVSNIVTLTHNNGTTTVKLGVWNLSPYATTGSFSTTNPIVVQTGHIVQVVGSVASGLDAFISISET